MAPKNPALKKNPILKDVKKNSSVKGYVTLAKYAKKGKPNSNLQKVILDQKNLANQRILSARVKNKLRNLSSAEQKRADFLMNEIYNNFLMTTSKSEKHFEFIKEFSKAINRKEGKEVLEIIQKANSKVKTL